jgi:transcriptional regulator with XRE-family HTH domain
VKEKTGVDTRWFRERLAERDISLRKLAKYMELDPSAVSLMVRGLRKMSAEEANRISGLLTIPVTEVLTRAGIPIEEDTRSFPVRAYLDINGFMHDLKGKQLRHFTAPRDVPLGALVLQVRAPETQQDGWMIVAGQFDARVQAMIDRLVVLEIAGGARRCGYVKRGYDPDRVTVIPFPSGTAVEDVSAVAAAPVLWIRPV